MSDWAITALEGVGPQSLSPKTGTATVPANGSTFDAALAAAGLRVSAHAGRRLASRDIQLGPPDAHRLAEAVQRAEQKGGRDSLILMDDLAFVVDIQRRTVVTAIDPESRKEGVFTNIDTVVLAK